MNRRTFLGHLGLGGLVATARPALSQVSNTATASIGPAFSFTTPLSLQNPTDTAMTVAIGVSGPSTAWVEYGETESLGRVATASRHGLKPYEALAQHIRIEGLQPGQRCFYRVHACPIDFRGAYDIRRGEAIATETFSFRTLNPDAAEARFAVWNDTHENPATLAGLMERTAPLSPDFLVWNGDIANDNYLPERMVANYIGAGGHAFTPETPLIFVRGNHETRGPAARHLDRIVQTPAGKFYYSFRHGPLAGVVLDTGEDKPDDHPVYAGLGEFVAYRQEQTAWLEAELNKPHLREARFRVAFCHIPFWRGDRGFASDPDDPRSAWHRLLVKEKFAAVISGHTHRYALVPPDANKPYAQLIGGGPKPEAATLIQGAATPKQLTLKIVNLDGRELATWNSNA